MSTFDPFWACLLTGVVFGVAIGERDNSFRKGYRAGFAALIIVLLGPVILIAVFHVPPQTFFGLLYAANIVFWGWALWPRPQAVAQRNPKQP